ncbi:GNAT family N-acetyltransferase [Thalassorhabdomicrobium marinisediminis]|uniref:GNAT family N-acetyltransferase n=1 Tax=Thalassorhabdomicrobium marinisediminis TaxID=2170577 RepID=UPI00249389DD|nr:N-acetyltransferase [Thalassorhabdomicrobium marinisediminis]
MNLRDETAADAWAVEALYDLTFAPGRKALSSYRLRDEVRPVPAFCRVVVSDDGVIGGAIRCWPVRVEAHDALLLGPVAVHPTRQGEGLGGLMIRDVLDRAAPAGWPRVLLVGDAPYYERFGFRKLNGVVMPPPTNPDRVLGHGPWAGVRGRVRKRLDALEELKTPPDRPTLPL